MDTSVSQYPTQFMRKFLMRHDVPKAKFKEAYDQQMLDLLHVHKAIAQPYQIQNFDAKEAETLAQFYEKCGVTFVNVDEKTLAIKMMGTGGNPQFFYKSWIEPW